MPEKRESPDRAAGIAPAAIAETRTIASTFRVRPQATWPNCDDSTTDIETFRQEVEDLVNLANDGHGMQPKEELKVIGLCLKQSRSKAFQVLMKSFRQSGLYAEDPPECLKLLWECLMKFQEDTL